MPRAVVQCLELSRYVWMDIYDECQGPVMMLLPQAIVKFITSLRKPKNRLTNGKKIEILSSLQVDYFMIPAKN